MHCSPGIYSARPTLFRVQGNLIIHLSHTMPPALFVTSMNVQGGRPYVCGLLSDHNMQCCCYNNKYCCRPDQTSRSTNCSACCAFAAWYTGWHCLCSEPKPKLAALRTPATRAQRRYSSQRRPPPILYRMTPPKSLSALTQLVTTPRQNQAAEQSGLPRRPPYGVHHGLKHDC